MRSLSPLLPVVIVLLAVAVPAQAAPPADSLAARVAAASGTADFDQVAALRFTFNVQKGQMHKQRSWVWSPATDMVTLVPGGKDDRGAAYLRSAVTDELQQVDGWFVNDSYWLLFPLHLAWDEFAALEESEGAVTSPIAGLPTRRLAVTYPSAGGYTPGDVYELYVDEADRVVEWVYRRGGAAEATRRASWQQYQSFGPLTLSLDRPGDDGNFRVWFTDVAVQVKGSDEWVGGGR